MTQGRGLIDVFIIESPGAEDLYEGRAEGETLAKGLGLFGILCGRRQVANKAQLERAVENAAAWHKGVAQLRAGSGAPERIPVLHFSGHGSHTEFELTDRSHVSWVELMGLVSKFRQTAGQRPIVAMSACHGSFALFPMALGDESDALWLVGSRDSPEWSQTLVGYMTLYHHLGRGTVIEEAIKAMRSASGHDGFAHHGREDAKQAFESLIESVGGPEGVRELMGWDE